MTRSIFARKLDLLYLTFFIIHVPVVLCVDLVPYYPTALCPTLLLELRKYYIDTYHDRLFIDPPTWIHAFFALELVYHLPVSLWAIKGLVNDDVQVPLQLLVFAIETAMTTMVCVVDMFTFEGYTREDKAKMAPLYVPYLILAVVMGIDMFFRLRKTIAEHAIVVGGKKRS